MNHTAKHLKLNAHINKLFNHAIDWVLLLPTLVLGIVVYLFYSKQTHFQAFLIALAVSFLLNGVGCYGIHRKLECVRPVCTHKHVFNPYAKFGEASYLGFTTENYVRNVSVLHSLIFQVKELVLMPFEKETYKILGAQIVGYDGVDKRIDVIATAIRAGMKADELKDLDLAYAPPYSSAKDPVNMAGFVAENIKNGVVKQFYFEDIPALRERNDAVLLDTRTAFEYMRGHADGFIHIPLDDLRERLGELDKTKKIYVMCQSGLRSYLATRILMQNGFDAYNFAGGFRLYSSIKNEELLSKQCYTCGMEK